MEVEHFEELDALNADYWWFATRFQTVWAMAVRQLRAAPRSVIDLGCGTGMFLDWLVTRKGVDRSSVLGCDASPIGLAAASRRGIPTRRLNLQADALDHMLPAPPDMFVMLDVLEHIENPVQALSAVRRASKPGGILVLTVPALPLLWSDWDERLGHYRRYTARALSRDLLAAGWAVDAVQYLFFIMLLPAFFRRHAGCEEALAFPRVSPTVNALLAAACRTEARLGRFLPAGTSLAAVARNPAA